MYQILNGIEDSSLIRQIIISELLRYFRLNLSDQLLNKWDNYLSKYNITLKQLLVKILNTMEFTTNKGKFIIMVSEVDKIDGVKISLLARLLNYGNTEIRGTKIISNGFNYLNKNLRQILLSYIR